MYDESTPYQPLMFMCWPAHAALQYMSRMTLSAHGLYIYIGQLIAHTQIYVHSALTLRRYTSKLQLSLNYVCVHV